MKLNKKIRRNKKGDASSIIVVVSILFILAAISLTFSDPFLKVLDKFHNKSEFDDTTKQTIQDVSDKTIPYLDYLWLFSFISIVIGLIISSLFIKSHPAFIIVFIILLIISVTMAGVLANKYMDIANKTQYVDEAAKFSYTSALMNIFPSLILIVGVIVIIVLYGKGKIGGGEGGEIYG